MYKTKLQELCHQKRWGLPRYTAMKDGPDHIPSFKASVSVNGLTFDSPGPCSSSKLAQNKAAMLAFLHFTSSDPTDSNQLSKTQLQNYDQRKSFDSAAFTIERGGLPQVPCMKVPSSVDGQCSERPATFSTSQEAEQAAAKVASMSLSLDSPKKLRMLGDSALYKNLLQELAQREGFCKPTYKTMRSGTVHMPTFFSIVEVEGKEFHGEPMKSKRQAEQDAAKVAFIALKESDKAQEKDMDMVDEIEMLPNIVKVDNEISSPSSLQHSEGDMMKTIKSLQSSEVVHESSAKECPSSPESSRLDLSAHSVSELNKAKTPEASSYLLHDRIRVYTSFPDHSFPEGITVLPIRENRWVAVSLEFPNEKHN
ncbi:double-stranded RNA-binding protein 1-like [Neltuma alba]|uniref:double-stranded RNA-binding protein 1-like n=1 Tax=Neltuma alba TaxID=207710 RepID=UPI0010A3250F|nr:double-stranded RNA-binding protein 1-like [Prosopis alba]